MTPERVLEKFAKDVQSAFKQHERLISELQKDLEATKRKVAKLEAQTAHVRTT